MLIFDGTTRRRHEPLRNPESGNEKDRGLAFRTVFSIIPFPG